jgi:cell division protein FtsA
MQATMERRAAAASARRDGRDGLKLSLGRPSVLAAVDLGATKVACFILKADGVRRADRTLNTAGVGYVQSRGVRGGVIVDVAEASRSIADAVQLAEEMAGVDVQGVTIVTACGQLASHRVSARVNVGARTITEADQGRAVTGALSTLRLDRRKAIHMRPIAWSVDGQGPVIDPRAMSARSLGLDLLVVSMKEGVLETLAHCVERAHLDLTGVVAAPYASALAALKPDEIELGAICIDMGGGSTSVAVFSGGALVHVDSLPVGGAHVTRDVAQGLTTSLVGAERIKTLHGSAIASANEDREIIVAPPRGDDPAAEPVSAPRSLLKGIIAPRVEETLELLKDRLKASGALEPGANIVLIGGASQLAGAREVATRVFDRTVRLGLPCRIPHLAQSAAGPGFCAAAGVLQRAVFGPYDLPAQSLTASNRQRRPVDPDANVMIKMTHWLKTNF